MPLEVTNVLGVNIIRFIFSDKREKNKFLSYTQMDERISLILPGDDSENLTSLAEDLQMELSSYNIPFIPICVDEGPLGFEQAGIVNSISRPLSNRGIHMFYISTFSTDYTLVFFYPLGIYSFFGFEVGKRLLWDPEVNVDPTFKRSFSFFFLVFLTEIIDQRNRCSNCSVVTER
eukprot:TRINITY_DN1223_c0_g1_i15.p1 TRINITY_DN1223_c0_g1~~TRINITY_DN1223_c0_g1_i15.p1  ORF type:complete len:175 (-),score=31.58 TRINITY_DN1223_c0_g1_i15:138-662(-)